MILEHDFVLVNHVFRECNMCVYALANVGCNIDDLHVFSEVSGVIDGLVEVDMIYVLASLEAVG